MALTTDADELKVQSDLLNPNFDGYKLSLEPLPTYKINLETEIDVATLTDKQFSYQHLKALGCHNHLIFDQWAMNVGHYILYFVDKLWNICCIELTTESGHPKLINVNPAFQIPNRNNLHLIPGRHNVTINFPAPDWAVIADGAGTLYLLETGLRKNVQDRSSSWQLRFTKSDVLGENRGLFILCDALFHTENESHFVECLILHVDEADEELKDKYNATFMTVLEWLTLSSDDKQIWSVKQTRRLRSSRSADCCFFEKSGKAIYIAGDRLFQMIYDSERPINTTEEKEPLKDDCPPEYTWMQNAESITVHFLLPEGTPKESIYITLQSDYIDVGFKTGNQLLSGQLDHLINTQESTWTLNDNKLEVYLSKRDGSMWSLVVRGNMRGEMVTSEEQLAEIHNRLSHLTSEQWNPDPDKHNKPFNSQQLEDCDAYPDTQAMLVRIDGVKHEITHQAHLGSHQWLFNTFTDVEKAPAVCLRHDVDGLVWQLGDDDSFDLATQPWRHVATFNAFGYVQASKQQKKFSTCPPDFSYAIISDCSKHCYIYRQPLAITSSIRNRKTGHQVTAVAKQQVLSLEAAENIMGVQATNHYLFILTPTKLLAVNMELH
ncbi:nudC domain-containing protein 1 [Octopus bimaculoides]|uniref:NudC domain-containing protein 1 n=1 Tax=Octopus bimaculoides TaxID=37653 RepID=A0A0L8FUX6_OCTBM|nr:nudC domain-containing protein 1 [Octopus bimaculoides]|eukprot:XP_014786647.1 PREDICTED: nudC domain-containing protein 1-like [Octopus bimaculoides]